MGTALLPASSRRMKQIQGKPGLRPGGRGGSGFTRGTPGPLAEKPDQVPSSSMTRSRTFLLA